MLILLLFAVVVLAYTNGANDNFKGVATLFGSGTSRYRTALAWATVTTLAGSLLAMYFATGLVETFKGKGLVSDEITTSPRFLLAVSFGAAATVLVATRVGMPVSTTHALTGALIGAGLLAANGDVRFQALGKLFVLPLLFAPLVAMLLAVMLYPAFSWLRGRSGLSCMTCVCVGNVSEVVLIRPDGSLVIARSGEALTVAEISECRTRYDGRAFGISAGPALDGLHYLSAGAVGFARGLNDTPKMVALLIAAQAVSVQGGLLAVAIAVGGIISARRVADTMSRKITRLNPGQGLTANLITAFLVTTASKLGLPVSTTHVSVGSLFGIGVVNGTARRRTVLSILLAWFDHSSRCGRYGCDGVFDPTSFNGVRNSDLAVDAYLPSVSGD